MWSARIILILLLFCSRVAAFDVLNISTITDRNGLSQNTIRCMMQDSHGFMWMGTINGLNRYNGKDFVVIQPGIATSQSSPDSRIRSITEDKHGYIWIRTFSNTLFCYDMKLEKIVDYDPQNTTKIFSQIMVTSNGDVWMWGDKGCCRVSHIDGELVSWRPTEKKLRDKSVTFIFEDSDRRVWIGADKELFMVAHDKVNTMLEGTTFWGAQELDDLYFIAGDRILIFDNLRKYFLPAILFVPTQTEPARHARSCVLNDGLVMIATNERMFVFDTINKTWVSPERFFQGTSPRNANFYIDNKGHIWVYNMSGVLWRHHTDNTFEPLTLIPADVLSLINQERFQIYHDSRDIIWITTFGNGLFAVDENTGKKCHYTADKDLSTNYLLCITEDTSGEVWVGTELGGVNKISLTNYPFDIFYPTPGGNDDRDNAVRLIYQDVEGRYWFGTRDGNLQVCDSTLHQLYKHRITGGLPFTIAEDTLGYKWLGTKGGGLLILSPQGDRIIKEYTLNDQTRQSSSSNNIFTIMRDSKNRMWLATFGGGLHLAEGSREQLRFKQFSFDNRHQNMMRSIIQDKTGIVWIGTNDGVIVFDPDGLIEDQQNFKVLHLYAEDQQSLGHNEVKVVFEDSKGRIWLGATGGGLNLLVKGESLEQSTFEHYGADDGLSNETIQAILEDEEGFIWVSTESGISKFNLNTKRFENFIFSNNRHAAIFNELSCWKKKNGELMFGSYNGVYTFNPSGITFDTYAPKVAITGFLINGNPVTPESLDSPLTESIINTRKVVLAYNQNSFNLECTMLNFHAPELNQYIYYLDGYESNWNRSSRNNVAAYRNVPPGKYLFKVKGCNSFGVWSDQETTLEIIILPPWWESTEAILLYIVLGIIIIYFTSRLVLKMHRLNMAVEVEKQLTEYKLRFFTNISHEFRTPLTIIRGAIEDLVNQKDLPSSVSKQLSLLSKSSGRLLRLVDQLLEFRRLQNNKMELKLERTDTKRFFYDIYLTFKDMAARKQIEYLFESNKPVQTMLLDRSKMDKIAYNLLSNAFKNTPVGGKIVMKLDFSVVNDTFTMSVSDNGPGVSVDKQKMLFVRFEQIHYASEGTGVGLHLTAELAKVHKGQVTYVDSLLGGACFSLTIPMSDENYDPADIIETIKEDKEIAMTELTTDISISEERAAEILGTSVNKPFKEYKVMVIDDDDDVRNLIEAQLGKYFTVSTASNGVEGLEKLIGEQPDIVVCDVMMPEMDGLEFTKRLKANFNISHIPVILLTAYSSEEHQLKGIQAGADSYITKPFSMKYLLARIVKLVEQREKLQRKFATEPGTLQPLISATDRDKAFLDKVNAIVEKNMGDAEFKLESYTSALNIGRTTFYNKLRGIVGCSPNEYVRVLRMKKAAELLLTTEMNVSEIGFQVGINDPFYFSKCFKNSFSKSPSQYRKSAGKVDTEENMNGELS